jgi:5'-nucleotidase (lipoprotein e(P4) family)
MKEGKAMIKKVIYIVLVISSYAFAEECATKDHDKKIEQSVKWYRNSAEKKAVYRQAFTIGEKYIKSQVKEQHLKPKSWGIILDIDETILDNTLYVKKCKQFVNGEDEFSKFIVLPKLSSATPGAKKLTCNVKKDGGYVSLVSNRDGSYPGVLKATLENLRQQGICFDQVVLANHKSAKSKDKNPRFNAIITGKYDAKRMFWSNKLPVHKVIAYFGDNIQDFPDFKQSSALVLDGNNSKFDKFGNGYFMLSNPIYGSWTANKDETVNAIDTKM